MAYTSFANGAVSYQAGQDAEFVVSVRVAFDGITPNCYNATRNYIIKIYPDVSDGQWYASYVFDMSNKGYLVGSEGEDGVIRFLPDDDITLGEFLTVIYRAAEIAAKIENAETGEIVDVVPYEKTMADHALQEQWISNEQHEELVYELPPDQHQGRAITREEAADILWKVFRSDECRVPHQLYEYDLNTEYRQTAWDAYTDKNFSNTGYGESFHQLFLNGVLAGSDAQTLDPRGNLTRAQACKIVSKALYSLAEIGTTLDPVWDESNIEELTVGETESGELSDYGGKNYWFNADKAGYYMVSTSADKYALYDAGGTRMEPVDEKDGKDVYMVTGAQEMRLYTAGVSGAGVTTTVEHAPNGYIAPQEVVFDHQEITYDENGNAIKHFYIMDDQPEHIRRCDVLDPLESDEENLGFTPTALGNYMNLEPGIYTIFSFHHVVVDNFIWDSSGNRVENNQFSFGVPFPNTQIYYDAIFYNNSGVQSNVTIMKYGLTYAGTWSNAWDDYRQNQSDIKYSINNSQMWVFDELEIDVNINDPGSGGMVCLIMDFKVEGGPVNLATVAFQNKESAKNNFGDGSSIHGYYETQNALKGIGAGSQTIVTDLEYMVDNTVQPGTRLEFYISNPLFPWRKQDIFTTNTSPMTPNNRWTTPESSMIDLHYTETGISRSLENGTVLDYETPNEQNTWFLDPLHTRFVETYTVTPEVASILGKSTFEPNELITEELLGHIRGLNGDDQGKVMIEFDGLNPSNLETRKGISSANTGYAMTYQINLTIHNVNMETCNIAYAFHGHLFHIVWEKFIDGVQVDWGGYDDLNETDHAFQIFNSDVPAGKTVTFKIYVTMRYSSNPTAHHGFFINADLDTVQQPLIPGAGNYPQD